MDFWGSLEPGGGGGGAMEHPWNIIYLPDKKAEASKKERYPKA